MTRPILGLDCDGVIADMNSYVLNVVNSEMGTKFSVDDWTNWGISKCLGEEAREIMQRLLGTPQIWSELSIYPGAEETLQKLSAVYDLYMVSAVWHKFYPLRKTWVEFHNLPFVSVIASSDKAGMALKHKMIGFIEDRQDHAIRVRDAGVKSYLVNRPYNWSENGIFRGSLGEIADSLL